MHRLTFAVLVAASAYSQTAPDPYTWTPVVPALAVARADACAVGLPDGSALVTGGVTTDGAATPTVEMFQPGIGFVFAPAMNTARAAHSCTSLSDGRVLVAGGNDGHGNPIGTAEIYDPSAQSWTIVADLGDPRWGHTATLLQNGRVLIAGGQDSLGQKDTLELFEPKKSAFVAVPVRLSSPRVNHATALLPDGIVAIIGGRNGGAALASVDLYDPARNVVIAAAALLGARSSHTASTLPDGTILVAGGWDGTNDLTTVEVYDLERGSGLALGKLNTPRHGHFAMTLPGNGNVLLGAGTGANSPLASCEVYNPADGTFTVIGPLGSPRARTTATPIGGGMVLSAGGVSTDGVTPITSTGVLASPSMTFTIAEVTNPYPGPLVVQGHNFGTGKRLEFQLVITNTAGKSVQRLDSINTTTSDFQVTTAVSLNPRGVSGTWTLTALGVNPPVVVSHPVVFANVTLVPSCTTCSAGRPVSFQVTVTNPSPNLFPGKLAPGDAIAFVDADLKTPIGSATLTPSGITGATNFSTTFQTGAHLIIASIGGTNKAGFGGTRDGFVGENIPFLALTVNAVPTTLSLAATPNPVATVGTVTLTPTLAFNTTLASGATPTGTITYSLNSTAGIFQLLGQGSATKPFSFTAPAGTGQYTIGASYSGDATFTASTSPQVTLTVSKPQAVEPFIGDVSSFATGMTWIVQLTNGDSPIQFAFGQSGWIPVTGDWAGFGQSGVGAFDPTTDTWHLAGPPSRSVSEMLTFQFGRASCSLMPSTGPPLVPFMGDWTGRGGAGVGVWDPSTGLWCLKNLPFSGVPDFQFQFAEFGFVTATNAPLATQVPVVGDWDGNGTTTVGVYDQTNLLWLLRNENSVGPADVNGGVLQFPTSNLPVGPFSPLAGNWTGTRTTVPGGIIIGVLGDNILSYISAGQLGLEDGFTVFFGDQFVSGTIAK